MPHRALPAGDYPPPSPTTSWRVERKSLTLQTDHNLVEYGPGGFVWATNRWTGGYLIMQGDGNLVGYDMWSAPQWSTGTTGNNCRLVVQNDSNLVIYCGGTAIWSRDRGKI